jgi:hypothetical protein
MTLEPHETLIGGGTATTLMAVPVGAPMEKPHD